jgi:EAL domain-containing protein (putative c-di-GMP-specific phosphodiesterase class I)
MQVAIDDAGAGYASMRHILKIRPDLIKLDISLTQNIDGDSTRRALAAALIAFAGETDATIVAEGIETEAELRTLERLGIRKAQGYYLARPAPLSDCLALLSDSAFEAKSGFSNGQDPLHSRARQALR